MGTREVFENATPQPSAREAIRSERIWMGEEEKEGAEGRGGTGERWGKKARADLEPQEAREGRRRQRSQKGPQSNGRGRIG